MVVARCLGALDGEMWTLKAAGIILDKSSVYNKSCQVIVEFGHGGE